MGHVRFNEPVIAPAFELFSGGQIGAEAGVFNASNYGLPDDVSSDDPTQAILDALDAADTYAAANETSFVVLELPVRAEPYVLSSPTIKGGDTLANAQIPLPIVDNDARKITLVIRGCVDAAAMPYWEQDRQQRWGVTLHSTLTGQTVDSNWGVPCVLGGPATSGSSAVYAGTDFNNLYVVVSGVGILTPKNPTVAGFDFAGVAQMRIENCAVMADYTSTGPGNLQGSATHDWSFGLRTPRITNNDLNIVDNVSVYGQYTAFIMGEHGDYRRLAAIYCHDGIAVFSQQDDIHSSVYDSVSVEACENGIICYANAENGHPVFMSAVSMETIGTDHVSDVTNGLSGEIQLTALGGPEDLSITGADNVRIIAANQLRGPLTAPDLPATTVSLQNPFWTDCDVLVSGGTVTGIAIDGINTGLTSGWFPLRSGGSIKLTYSDATGLAWKWWGH